MQATLIADHSDRRGFFRYQSIIENKAPVVSAHNFRLETNELKETTPIDYRHRFLG